MPAAHRSRCMGTSSAWTTDFITLTRHAESRSHLLGFAVPGRVVPRARSWCRVLRPTRRAGLSWGIGQVLPQRVSSRSMQSVSSPHGCHRGELHQPCKSHCYPPCVPCHPGAAAGNSGRCSRLVYGAPRPGDGWAWCGEQKRLCPRVAVRTEAIRCFDKPLGGRGRRATDRFCCFTVRLPDQTWLTNLIASRLQ